MAILVTGGAGYIGSVVVEDLRGRGETVVVLDNLAYGHRQAVDESVPFYQGSIGDTRLVRKILDEHRVTACMHFSAYTYVGESVEQPARYFENNFVETLHLLEALRENDVDKFIFSSTCATYGVPQRIPIDEGHPQWPINPYGWTKLMVERALDAYDLAYGLKYVGLRYFNAAGASGRYGEDHDPETHLIPLVLKAALGQIPKVSVFGTDYDTPDGTAVRDYIHVSDLSSAHLLALDHLIASKRSEFINLGNGSGYSVKEVIETARRITGRVIPAEDAPRRTGDPPQLVGDSERAREALGWNPQFPDLEKIIESAWVWHQRIQMVTMDDMTRTKISKNRISTKAASFTESVIREMTREALKYGAVNLGQGFPDFAAPEDIKQKAMQAIADDFNQYAITWGVKSFRDAIAAKTKWFLGFDIDPETEITVTCGSTEGMIAAMMATVDEGEEVVVFEPFYENYAPDAILSDATPRHVALRDDGSGFAFDHDELRAAFNERTKAIIICNPNNPTGKVFTQDELEFIASLCKEFDALAFTDEIYEHILYPHAGADIRHITMANIDGMRERTVVVNSMSKTYSVTGWRVGYCIAPPDITSAIRKVHDFLTVGAANCLQHAGAYALSLPASYYDELQREYQKKRDFIVPVLQKAGFKCDLPDGAYYVMCDISDFGFADDIEFTKHLIREIGVAVVPGSSFYHDAKLGSQQVRFCFCKKDETLEAAAERLANLSRG